MNQTLAVSLANHLSLLCLSILNCRMGVIVALMSQGCFEHQMRYFVKEFTHCLGLFLFLPFLFHSTLLTSSLSPLQPLSYLEKSLLIGDSQAQTAIFDEPPAMLTSLLSQPTLRTPSHPHQLPYLLPQPHCLSALLYVLFQPMRK